MPSMKVFLPDMPTDLTDGRFQGTLYRALNPVYAQQPLSGEGARRHGGRFNPKGVPALYCALSVMTAIREANQVGSLQPTTLVSYTANVGPVFDGRSTADLAQFGSDPDQLAAADWRLQMFQNGRSQSQTLAQRLIDEGFVGICVPSFAKGATGQDINLVLWTWSGVELIDDDNRLSPNTLR